MQGNISSAAVEAMQRHEQKTQAAGEASLEELLRDATKAQLEVLTTDSALVNAIFEQRIPFARTIVYLQLEGGEVEQDDAIDRLFQRYKRLSPGRMYTVTGKRVKVRQLPGKP